MKPTISRIEPTVLRATFLAITMLSAGSAHASPPLEARKTLHPIGDASMPYTGHNFSAYCFGTMGCTVFYAGYYTMDADSTEAFRSFQGEGDLKDLSASQLAIVNFPAPALLAWKSKDGKKNSVSVDIGKIFTTQNSLHNVPSTEVARNAFINFPEIILVVDDRTINAYMRTFVPTEKHAESADKQLTARFDLILAYSHKYSGVPSKDGVVKPSTELDDKMVAREKLEKSEDREARRNRVRESVKRMNASAIRPSVGPHRRLFVANFDGTRDFTSVNPDLPSQVAETNRMHHADPDTRGRVSSRYVIVHDPAHPAPRSPVASTGEGKYGLFVEGMYRELTIQSWKWLQEDPQADIRMSNSAYGLGADYALEYGQTVEDMGIIDPSGVRIDTTRRPLDFEL